jgi:8-oxo-dGTP pyrophosphatase MutT (NUDIX family)
VFSIDAPRGAQCAALPLRETPGGPLVLLVTSRDTGRWVLPKGWLEPELTGAEAAAKEAYEEAGLTGRVDPAPIGTYRYAKRLPQDRTTPCTVQVHLMHVERELEAWPERGQRRRRWFGLAEAAMLVEEPGLRALLRRLAPKVAA